MEYKFKTIKVSGKDYIQIVERLKYFKQEKKYEGWSIETELLSVTDDKAFFKALIKDKDGNTKAVGHSHKKINIEFNLEKCETRAIGRALGLLGIGIENSIATADEVMDAIRYEKSQVKISDKNNKESKDIITAINKIKTKKDLQEYGKRIAVITKDFEKNEMAIIQNAYIKQLKIIS